MSEYRSELYALRLRIADAEQTIRELVAERTRRDARRGFGPNAPSLFYRWMYRAGWRIGRFVRRLRGGTEEMEIARARELLEKLEERIRQLRSEVPL